MSRLKNFNGHMPVREQQLPAFSGGDILIGVRLLVSPTRRGVGGNISSGMARNP